MECIVCGIGISKKARTCGPTCRSKLARSVAKPSVASPVVVSVADLEQCRYCSAPLPPLHKPRRHPGACYPCAMKAPRKCSLDALGDTVSGGSERPVEAIV